MSQITLPIRSRNQDHQPKSSASQKAFGIFEILEMILLQCLPSRPEAMEDYERYVLDMIKQTTVFRRVCSHWNSIVPQIRGVESLIGFQVQQESSRDFKLVCSFHGDRVKSSMSKDDNLDGNSDGHSRQTSVLPASSPPFNPMLFELLKYDQRCNCIIDMKTDFAYVIACIVEDEMRTMEKNAGRYDAKPPITPVLAPSWFYPNASWRRLQIFARAGGVDFVTKLGREGRLVNSYYGTPRWQSFAPWYRHLADCVSKPHGLTLDELINVLKANAQKIERVRSQISDIYYNYPPDDKNYIFLRARFFEVSQKPVDTDRSANSRGRGSAARGGSCDSRGRGRSRGRGNVQGGSFGTSRGRGAHRANMRSTLSRGRGRTLGNGWT